MSIETVTAAQMHGPRLPAGTLVLTPQLAASMKKRGALHEDPARPGLLKWGAYHASQDTRFRDYSTGGFGYSSRPEADYFTRLDRAKVVARQRLAFRNNPHLAASVDAYVSEIGVPHFKSQTPDPLYNDLKERFLERRFRDIEADVDLSLAQVVRIYNYEDAVGGGELFILKRIEGWLQLIASELCGSVSNRRALVNIVGASPQKFSDGTVVPVGATERNGIIYDAAKFKIGYRFGTRDDAGLISFAPERSTLVPVGYVYHLYDPQRVEQDRGVPLCVPVMDAFQDLFETADARAQQVKNASCLSMWITKNIDPYGYAETMRGSLNRGDVATAAELKETVAQRSQYQEIKKGSVYYGAVGEELQLIEPKLNAGDFHVHYIDLMQVACASFRGMPVEIALEGFRDSSYSSSRASLNKWKRNVKAQRKFIDDKFLDPLQLWQSNRAHIFGDLIDPPASPPDTATHNTDEDCFWGWPPIPDIDDAKTAATDAMNLANGTTTRDEILADRGRYGDIQDKAFAREKGRLLKELIAEGTTAGLPPDAVIPWAIAQMPAQDAKALAALVPLLVGSNEPAKSATENPPAGG